MNFQSISALFLAILAIGGWAHDIDVKSKGMFKMHIGTHTHSSPASAIRFLSCIREWNQERDGNRVFLSFLSTVVLASVSNVAGKVAFKMMQFYPGNKTGGIPGLFGDPYYWWEAGAVFGVSFLFYSILFILSFITQPSTSSSSPSPSSGDDGNDDDVGMIYVIKKSH